jgi:hypothetical protein
MIYLSTAIGLTPGGSSKVKIYTKKLRGTTKITTQNSTHNNRTTQMASNLEECWLCSFIACFTPVFALQLRKKHGKTHSD